MSVFKTLTSQDIIVSPFEVNKSFTFIGGDTLLSASIQRYIGTNNGEDLIYNSIKQLYYSNYISGSDGNISNSATASIGSDGLYYGEVYSTLYQNYLATDLNPQRYFPTSSGNIIGVMSIPKELFGDYIQPNSLHIVTPSGSYKDDGEGRLYNSSILLSSIYGTGIYGGSIYGNTIYCGNVIYEHGIVVLIKGGIPSINNFISSTDIQVSFSSSYTLYETQYKCTISENEFNYTNNPSVITGSDGRLYNHFTGSYFAPYVTTIGLYNNNEELLAIGKLAQPLPTSRTSDMNIILSIDRL